LDLAHLFGKADGLDCSAFPKRIKAKSDTGSVASCSSARRPARCPTTSATLPDEFVPARDGRTGPNEPINYAGTE